MGPVRQPPNLSQSTHHTAHFQEFKIINNYKRVLRVQRTWRGHEKNTWMNWKGIGINWLKPMKIQTVRKTSQDMKIEFYEEKFKLKWSWKFNFETNLINEIKPSLTEWLMWKMNIRVWRQGRWIGLFTQRKWLFFKCINGTCRIFVTTWKEQVYSLGHKRRRRIPSQDLQRGSQNAKQTGPEDKPTMTYHN